MTRNPVQRLLIIIVMGFLVGFAVPIQAQDSTTEIVLATNTPAQAVITDATPDPESTAAPETSITVEDGGTVNIDAPETSNLPSLLTFIYIIAAAVVGGGSFAVIWERIRRSKEAKDTIERLAEGLSPTWKSTLDRFIDTSEQILKTATEMLTFAREVTDGKPNLPPPEADMAAATPAPYDDVAVQELRSQLTRMQTEINLLRGQG